jgi:C-terminal processing protease CtpA/Prc
MNRGRTRMLFCLFLMTTMFVAAQAPSGLITNTLEVLKQNYVNPLGTDLAKLEGNLQTAMDSSCKPTCDAGDAERIIARALQSVGDVHLSLSPFQPRASDDPGKVGANGRYAHFGIRTVSSGTQLYVVYVQPDSNAAQQNLQSGNIIIRVSGAAAAPADLEAALARAETAQKSVSITVRDGTGRERGVLLSPSPAAWNSTLELRAEGTAILRIPSLSASNRDAEAIHAAVRRALEAGAKKFVLDLRMTDGGTPFATASAAGAFLERVPITLVNKAGVRWNYVFQNGDSSLERSDQPGKRETDRLAQPALWKGALVVLISSRTVSAGENFAFLLQNNRRAKVVGEATAGGAGVGANVFNLSSGARLLVATHLHLTPEGKRYPTRVTPDLEVKQDFGELARGRDAVLEAGLKLLANQ